MTEKIRNLKLLGTGTSGQGNFNVILVFQATIENAGRFIVAIEGLVYEF